MATELPLNIEQLLDRPDIWRGNQYKIETRNTLSTGHTALDAILIGHGWPNGGLIEMASKGIHCDWFIVEKTTQKLCINGHYIALISPPYLPFSHGIYQYGIPLEQLIILTPQNKQDFMACFIEVARSPAFHVIQAWSDKFHLTYSEQRKLHLSTLEQHGLYTLHTPYHALKNASPLALRIAVEMSSQQLSITIKKQKGGLREQQAFIALPSTWCDQPTHPNLLNVLQKKNATTKQTG